MLRPVLVVAALLALAAPARAATVSLSAAGGGETGSKVNYVAGAGERNRVTIAGEPTGGVLVTDAGSPLFHGGGCANIDASTVSCPPGSAGAVAFVSVSLADGDDGLEASSAPGHPWTLLAVSAGTGNDTVDAAGVHAPSLSDVFYGVTVEGGPGADVIIGSDGSDDLAGGAGRDELHGLGGDDLLDGDGTGETETGFDAAAADVIDGGPGTDTVTYAAHRRGVKVDLTHPSSAGSPKEGDQLSGIENVIGSAFSDNLIGGRGPNDLTGFQAEPFATSARGGDRLSGGGGDDDLSGSRRADRFFGGGGNDSLALVGGADTTSCGAGRDTVRPGGNPLVLSRSCERVDDGSTSFGSLKVAKGRLGGGLFADSDATQCTESVHVKARRGGASYGSASWSDPAPAKLSIKLNAAGRRAAKRKAQAVVRAQGCVGGVAAWIVRL
ncbi:MAG TPA: hypothetical protein VGI54_07880 [Solirubrobacteraceae bacterium]